MRTGAATIEEEQIEREIRAKWETDAALRDDFAGSLEACVAYHKAMARGLVRVHGGATVSVRPGGRGGNA